MKMLIDARDARQMDAMKQAVISLQLANRAIVPGHAKRLIRQAIAEAERVIL